MKKNSIWLLISFVFWIFIWSGNTAFATWELLSGDDSEDGQEVQLEILPKAEWSISEINDRITKNEDGQHVRDTYNDIASNALAWPDKVDEQIASGVMTRDTIIDYGVLLLKFLSQIGLLIGGLMIIFAGYKYIMSVFSWDAPDSWLVKNAIVWVLVIIFSYAIIRILTRAFLT